MEEKLTDCLVNIKGDLSELQRIQEYLESQPSENYSLTWRTIEAFNSILAACSSRDTPDIQALETLLDSFYYVASCNNDESSWNHFSFELGVISVKILSVIEQTDMFEVFFYKLLAVINKICQHNSDAWKAVARQILNVFINKRLSFFHTETLLKLYISILRNVESLVLYNFSEKNLHLLKTFSMLVQRVGDFETQMNIVEMVFLHVANDKRIIDGFFSEVKDETRELFCKLQFIDFEDDCRTYLNSLNKSLGEFERQVFSVCCSRLYLGGCFLEPPTGRKSIWLDINKDSERLSFKCSEFQSETDTTACQCVIFIQFSDVLSAQVEHEKDKKCYRLTFKAKNLDKIHAKVKNNDVFCLALEADNPEESVLEFKNILEDTFGKNDKKKKKEGKRLSQTCDSLVIDRNVLSKESCLRRFPEVNFPSKSLVNENNLQDNAISSSINCRLRSGINSVIPGALSLFERVENKSSSMVSEQGITEKQNGGSSKQISREKLQNITNKPPDRPVEITQTINFSPERRIQTRQSKSIFEARKSNKKVSQIPQTSFSKIKKQSQSPSRDENIRNIVLESQELTPNSFVESLNKNLGLDSPDARQSFENSLVIGGLTQGNTTSAKKSHKLFRSPERIFNFLENEVESSKNNFLFEKSLENKENEPPSMFKLPLASVKGLRKAAPTKKTPNLISTRVLRERKDLEVKLFDSHSDEYFRKTDSNLGCKKKKPSLPKLKRSSSSNTKNSEKNDERKKTKKPGGKERPEAKITKTRKPDPKNKTEVAKKSQKNQKQPNQGKLSFEPRSSLLDPNGYAYQRWLQPTTSERSNFWLNKLKTLQKDKTDRKNVFDFSDGSDDDLSRRAKKGKPKRKKVVSSAQKPKKTYGRKPKKEESTRRRPPLTQIKGIIKSCDFNPRDSHKTQVRENAERRGEKMKVSSVSPPGNRKQITRNQETKSNKEAHHIVVQNENSSDYSIQDFSQKCEKEAVLPKLEVTHQNPEKSSEPDSGSEGNESRLGYDNIIMRRSSSSESNDEKSETNVNFTQANKNFDAHLPDLSLEDNEAPEENVLGNEEPEENLDCNEEPEQNPENNEPEENIVSDEDYLDLSEDENDKHIKTNKRQRSDEENSLTKTAIKKKSKTRPTFPALPLALQRRLQIREEKARKETDEIIKTVNKAMNQLLNHIYLKERKEIASYLDVAKKSSSGLEESDDFHIRSKRFDRLKAYFKAGCSVSPMCDVMNAHFSEIRGTLKDVTGNATNNAKKIERFNDRLKSLIRSEIDKSIRKEFISSRNRLLRCASAFDPELGSSVFL